MLANSPIRPVLLATDLEAAREFYHEKLGLPILLEREGAIEFSCGGATRLAVSTSTLGTADSQTQVAWSVLTWTPRSPHYGPRESRSRTTTCPG